MRCWLTIRMRCCGRIAPPCSRSCAHCLPASPSCRVSRAEHRFLAVLRADQRGWTATDHWLSGVHGVLPVVDLLLRHLLFLRLPHAALPAALPARARVGACDPRGAALDLPARLSRRGRRATA